MNPAKTKFDLLWLVFSILLVAVGGFFIISGIWGLVVRNNAPITPVAQIDTITSPTGTASGSITTTPTITGQVGEGISTSRDPETVKNNEAKPQTQTGKWVANDYVKGDIKTGNYQVRRGDTLWEIAEAVYGNGAKWTKIRDANKSQIRKLKNGQRALIVPGQVLKIP